MAKFLCKFSDDGNDQGVFLHFMLHIQRSHEINHQVFGIYDLFVSYDQKFFLSLHPNPEHKTKASYHLFVH